MGMGTTSDGKAWFTVQDDLQFASGGASESRAQQNIATLVKDYVAPAGFHYGR